MAGWEEWLSLPVREQDQAVHTVRGRVRIPTVIIAVNYSKVPKKRPKLSARSIRERDGNRCQYTGRLLQAEEGSLDHVVPRSWGGRDTWENLVWAAKEVNQRKADRLPHEAGLRLLATPRVHPQCARNSRVGSFSNLNLQPKGKPMRPVLRFQSQLLFRKSYKPNRIVRIRPTGKPNHVFRPSRAGPPIKPV